MLSLKQLEGNAIRWILYTGRAIYHNHCIDYHGAHSIYQEQQDVDKTQWPRSLGHRTAGGAATRSAMRGADRPTIRYDQEAYSTRVQRDIAGFGVNDDT
jgi:hypothetical protein